MSGKKVAIIVCFVSVAFFYHFLPKIKSQNRWTLMFTLEYTLRPNTTHHYDPIRIIVRLIRLRSSPRCFTHKKTKNRKRIVSGIIDAERQGTSLSLSPSLSYILYKYNITGVFMGDWKNCFSKLIMYSIYIVFNMSYQCNMLYKRGALSLRYR